MVVVKCQRKQHRCLFCCSLDLVRVLIVVIMGRWSEFSACIVCHVVRLYSVRCLVRWPAVVCKVCVCYSSSSYSVIKLSSSIALCMLELYR